MKKSTVATQENSIMSASLLLPPLMYPLNSPPAPLVTGIQPIWARHIACNELGEFWEMYINTNDSQFCMLTNYTFNW